MIGKVTVSVCLLFCLIAAPAWAQWGLIRATQIEDAYLRNDGDDLSSGGLELGGGLEAAGPILAGSDIRMATWTRIQHLGVFVQWYSAFEIRNASYAVTDMSARAMPLATNGTVFLVIDLPSVSYGADLVLDSITLYGATTTSGAYVTQVALTTLNPVGGSLSVQRTNDTDVGNGTSGQFSHGVLASPAGPYDAPVVLRIKTAGMTSTDQVLFFAARITWHRA